MAPEHTDEAGTMDERTASPVQAGDVRAVIYLRVSTREQAEMGGEAEGYSIPAQRAACTRKAGSLNAFVTEEFVDRGESAKTANRPELMNMLRYLREHPVQYVIVHKVDRLARNRADDVAITVAVKNAGATLVSCSENIDETPSGLLLHGIMSSIAEFYSANLATEVRKGMDQKAKTGGTPTKAPVGYLHVRRLENGHEVKTIEVDPDRAPLVLLAFQLYATGQWTISELNDKLADMGLTSRPGPNTPAKRMSRAAFHMVLCNPYYIGKVKHRGMQYDGNHPPLIPLELFNQVQAMLVAHRHAGEKQQTYIHYLKGSIFCGTCGAKLSLMNPRSCNGDLYHYFFCLGRQYNKHSCSQKVMDITQVEKLVEEHYLTIQLPEERVAEITYSLRQALADHREEAEAAERLETLRISRLSKEREKLLQLHYADAVPADLFKQEAGRITRELEEARRQLAIVSVSFDTIEKNMERALKLARDCYTAYKDADDTTRRLFNQAFFDKLLICYDGTVTHELAEPFKLLLDPDLVGWFKPKGRSRKAAGASNTARRADNANSLAFGQAVGSNNETLVGDTGFEPAR